MNDINEMPPKCQYCPYWEVCEYPWVCPDREQLATNLQQTCNQLTTDTISRRAAIDAFYKRFDSIPMEQTTEILQLRKDLRELPSAQPEIIRCKDCKYSEHWYRDKRRCFLWHETGIDVFEDGYCNYAERKDNG